MEAGISRNWPSVAPADRAGWSHSRSSWLPPWCRSSWSRARRDRAAPGSPGCRSRPPAEAWRSCAAAYEARAFLLDLGEVARRPEGSVELPGRNRVDLGPRSGEQPALRGGLRASSRATASSRLGDSITCRSLRPLPRSTRIGILSLSISGTRRWVTSLARSPQP